MEYSEIIQLAWRLTQKYKNDLFWYAIIPSFVTTLVGMVVFFYHAITLRYSFLFSEYQASHSFWETFSPYLSFLKAHPSFTIFLLVISFLVFALYMLSPNWSAGALIHLINKALRKQPLEGGGIKGMEKFFLIFQFSAFMSVVSPFFLFTETVFILKNASYESLIFLLPLISGLFVLGMFISALGTFSEQFIVLGNRNVFIAMKDSAFMVLSNVKDILFLTLIVLLIGVRIILNVLLILIIPFIVMGILTFAASLALQWVGIVVSVFIACVLLGIGAYLMAGFYIFSYAVWTISYLYFLKKQEEV